MALFLILAATLGGGALLLSIPLELRFFAALDGPGSPLRHRAKLHWAGGMLTVDLRPRGPRRSSPRMGEAPRHESRLRRQAARLVRLPALWRRLLVISRRVLRTVDWRDVRIDARLGLDDPADTGRLFGVILPALPVLTPRSWNVNLRPVFDGLDWGFRAEGSLRVIPLTTLAVLMGFLLSPTTWRILWPVFSRR